MSSCINVVAKCSAIPEVLFVEEVQSNGIPVDGKAVVALQVGSERVSLNAYRLRELKSLIMQAERAIERQQESIFLKKNLSLDF